MKYEDVYREMSEELIAMIGAEQLAFDFYSVAKAKTFEMRSNETATSLLRFACERIVEQKLDALISRMSDKRGGRFYFIGLDYRDLAEVLSENMAVIWPEVNTLLHVDMQQMFPEELFKTKLENILLMQSPRAMFNQFLNWHDEMKVVNPALAEKQIPFALAVRSMSRLASLLPDWADKSQVCTDDGSSLAAALADLKARVKAGLPVRGRV